MTLADIEAMAGVLAEAAQRIAALEKRVAAAEKAHADLVAEIQAMINQMTGGGQTITAADTARIQQLRMRAVRIARLRAQQNPKGG